MFTSKYITSIFQSYLDNRDIRYFKNKILYYLIFRIIRNFLNQDIIIKIYNFKVFGSIKKYKHSYFLLKKCDFYENHELSIIKKFSKKNDLLFLDCGCNYGFYSFYVASLNKKNLVIAIEASKKTSKDFLKNLKINLLDNINFQNKAISNLDNQNIQFNESKNDWESSYVHKNFKLEKTTIVESIKIDTLVKHYNLKSYTTIIKLDIEGNEMNAIKGGLEFIKMTSPLIIIEISKYIFNNNFNIEYFRNFLKDCDYSIYDTNKKKITLDNALLKLNQLPDKYKTIGNCYLIKNLSTNLKKFISDE
jgi:FkbM family methyltransferase